MMIRTIALCVIWFVMGAFVTFEGLKPIVQGLLKSNARGMSARQFAETPLDKETSTVSFVLCFAIFFIGVMVTICWLLME